MKIYFITTNHLDDRIWFRDNEDFKVGMNYVAVTVSVTGVVVIAFVLMSNHVHFIIICEDRAAARRFINHYKKLYGTYYHNKYGDKRFLRRNDVDIQEIILGDESVERVVAYIVMNSVAARICAAPNGYKWGSGACYFNDNKEKGRRLDSMSVRSRHRTIKSKAELPGNWIIGAEEFILPESYVAVDFVEKLFRNPSRYNYFLNSSSKAKKVRDLDGPSFRDQLILEGLQDLCVTLFNKRSIKDLSVKEKAEVARQLRWRFSADSHQISRVTGIPYPELTELLSSI